MTDPPYDPEYYDPEQQGRYYEVRPDDIVARNYARIDAMLARRKGTPHEPNQAHPPGNPGGPDPESGDRGPEG